jgi:carbon monoxide dehydrogenase subunit G
MATLRHEFVVDAAPALVWDALRDFAAVHTRLAPGFVTACEMEQGGEVRHITFANGYDVRERLVGIDEQARRLAYTVVGGKAAHHHASAQVLAEPDGRARFVWITDVLPHEAAGPIGAMMALGAQAMAKALAALGPFRQP